MRHDPFREPFQPFLPICDRNDDIDELLLRVFESHAIEREEHEHDVDTYALVTVDEGMVRDEAETEPSRLLLKGGIEIDVVETCKRSGESRLEQTIIGKPLRPTSPLHELPVQGKHLLL